MTQLHRLSAAFVKNAPVGKHSDGSGLWLIKRSDGGSQWMLRISISGKRREMGLGGIADVSLKEARELAAKYRKLSKAGIDPIDARLSEKRAQSTNKNTLEEIALSAYEARKASLKNDGINARWFSPLQIHVLPKLGKWAVETITQKDIVDTLQPIWHTKSETAKKAIIRLNIVMTHAAALGYDVDMTVIAKAKALLGERRHQTQHTPSLPWASVPTFYASISEPTIVNLALKFLILTGARSFAVRHARLEQFDNNVWIIPAKNMKGKIGKVFDFHLPLSTEAQSVIEAAKQYERDGYLFTGLRSNVISDASMARLMERRGMKERPHGFRSSLRSWLADCTKASEQVAETVLAHKVGDNLTQAYRRTDHFEERAILMERWARHVIGEENVIDFRNTK